MRDPGLGHAPYVKLVEKAREIVGTQRFDRGEEEEDDDADDRGEAILVKVHWQSAIPDVYFALNSAPGTFQAIACNVD